MDWKKINDECPKAFLELLKSHCPEAAKITDVTYKSRWLTISYINNEWKKASLMTPDFLEDCFDTIKINIWAYPSDTNGEWLSKIRTVVSWGLNTEFVRKEGNNRYFPDRRSALEEGVKEAFRIREQQLNDGKV